MQPLLAADPTPSLAGVPQDPPSPPGRTRRQDDPNVPRKKSRQVVSGPLGSSVLQSSLVTDPTRIGKQPGSIDGDVVVTGGVDDSVMEPGVGVATDAKARTLARRLGEQHHHKLREMIKNQLRQNVHIKKKMWYQDSHSFYQELPINLQRNFSNADELAKMVYNDVIGSTTRWRKVMYARLNQGEPNKQDFIARLQANPDLRAKVSLSLAAIVLPAPYFLPTPQEIQRADLNLEQWILE